MGVRNKVFFHRDGRNVLPSEQVLRFVDSILDIHGIAIYNLCCNKSSFLHNVQCSDE